MTCRYALLPVEPVTMADKPWVMAIWKPEQRVLGVDPGSIFWRYFNGGSSNEHWVKISTVAFCHYRDRLDGTTVIYEIAVDPLHRRQGLARKLIRHIDVGRQIVLKTDAEHEESNIFYQRLGFTLLDRTQARSGKWLNHYVLSLVARLAMETSGETS